MHAIEDIMGSTNWRFLNTKHQDAFMNMAIDEVLSRKSGPGDRKSILRVYGWNPYAISLGYNQDVKEIDLKQCRKDNIDVVRRPTGGRAVFHAEEVTYSVVLPKGSGLFDEDTLTVYNAISEALVTGLKLIGVDARLAERRSDSAQKMNTNIPCFSSSAKYEICHGGRKLVGSAQRRFPEAILQHGSILVGIRHLDLGQYLSDDTNIDLEAFTKALARKTVSISQIINQSAVNYDKVIWGIKNGFQNRYKIQFFEGQLTDQELKEAQKLVPKYKMTSLQ
jgi:lipoate-protein ligase A